MDKVEQVLEEGLEDLFKPTPRQRKVKAGFWSKVNEYPFSDAERITLAEATKITKERGLKDWWPNEKFKEWFLDRDEHRKRMEYLFDLALDAAEDIITNQDPKAQSARVNMIKTLAELANKFPNKYAKPEFLDVHIQKMDEGQLRAFVEKQLPKHATVVKDITEGVIVDEKED